METTIQILVFSFVSLFIAAWSYGEELPSNEEIKKAFVSDLPVFITLKNIDIDLIENVDNKIDLNWGSRFKAIVKTNVSFPPLADRRKKR